MTPDTPYTHMDRLRRKAEYNASPQALAATIQRKLQPETIPQEETNDPDR